MEAEPITEILLDEIEQRLIRQRRAFELQSKLEWQMICHVAALRAGSPEQVLWEISDDGTKLTRSKPVEIRTPLNIRVDGPGAVE